jgi:hypothetical protein
MDDNKLQRGYRNAWILTGLSLAFIVGFFLFTVKTNRSPSPVEFDMGGTSFVPARGVHSEGYAETYVPAGQPVGEASYDPARSVPAPEPKEKK